MWSIILFCSFSDHCVPRFSVDCSLILFLVFLPLSVNFFLFFFHFFFSYCYCCPQKKKKKELLLIVFAKHFSSQWIYLWKKKKGKIFLFLYIRIFSCLPSPFLIFFSANFLFVSLPSLFHCHFQHFCLIFIQFVNFKKKKKKRGEGEENYNNCMSGYR